MKEIADFMRLLNCDVVAFHLGSSTITPIHSIGNRDPQDLLDHCNANNQALHLETGRETAEELQFISDVGRTICLSISTLPT